MLLQVSMEVSVQPSGDNYSDSRGENIADMVERGRPAGGGANGLYYPRCVCVCANTSFERY